MKTDWGIQQSFEDWVENTYKDNRHSSRVVTPPNLFLDGTWKLDGSNKLNGQKKYGNHLAMPTGK